MKAWAFDMHKVKSVAVSYTDLSSSVKIVSIAIHLST